MIVKEVMHRCFQFAFSLAVERGVIACRNFGIKIGHCENTERNQKNIVETDSHNAVMEYFEVLGRKVKAFF